MGKPSLLTSYENQFRVVNWKCYYRQPRRVADSSKAVKSFVMLSWHDYFLWIWGSSESVEHFRWSEKVQRGITRMRKENFDIPQKFSSSLKESQVSSHLTQIGEKRQTRWKSHRSRRSCENSVSTVSKGQLVTRQRIQLLEKLSKAFSLCCVCRANVWFYSWFSQISFSPRVFFILLRLLSSIVNKNIIRWK